jgi:tRNA-specific 2-thiouridylase
VTHRQKPTVLVAMSGGVDSSVAAALLHEQGYEVVGATLKLWCYEDTEPAKRSCCSAEAIRDARSIAVNLGFTHYVLDYEDLFRTRVAEPFIEAYLSGSTPYPCAACNSDLKFGRLFEQAREIGADYLASGHYVRRRDLAGNNGDPEASLWRASHRAKDQTYALWGISPEVLPHLLFPLGDLSKDEVRQHADRFGFSEVSQRLESQDLCFVGGPGRYAEYLSQRAGRERVDRAGPIFDVEGKEIGEHRGLAHYTVGQRKGLGVSAGDPSAEPLYVISLEPEQNALHVGPAGALMCPSAVTGEANWLTRQWPKAGRRFDVQIRYQHDPAPARLYPSDESAVEGEPFDPAGGVKLVFDFPQRAVTPGQSAVFYDEDRLIGGGELERPDG